MIAVPMRRPAWRRFTDWLLMVADQVAAAVIATDRDALVAELFQQEGTRLVRLARLFTDDRNAAEDLVQEAFIRLHRAAPWLIDAAAACTPRCSAVVREEAV